MARRLNHGGRIPLVYAMIGPSRSRALRYCRGDVERARRMRADWDAWRDRHQLAWAQGKAVPPPPHYDTLGAGVARTTR
jgi:hypothetical protein